jgi:hypothetical protein
VPVVQAGQRSAGLGISSEQAEQEGMVLGSGIEDRLNLLDKISRQSLGKGPKGFRPLRAASDLGSHRQRC